MTNENLPQSVAGEVTYIPHLWFYKYSILHVREIYIAATGNTQKRKAEATEEKWETRTNISSLE